MKSLSAIVLLISVALVVQALPRSQRQRTRPDSSGRIILGQVASRGQFPHQVAINIENGLAFGGGSLITPTWVLTAGHVVAFFNQWTMYFGAQNLSASEPGTVTLSSTTVVTHPGFKFVPYNNSVPFLKAILHDIALIQLPEPVQLTEFIKLVKLPTLSQELDTFVGRNAITSGWGLTNGTATESSDILMYLELTVISNYDCYNSNMGGLIGGNQICAAGVGIQSICGGDSGGALVIDDGAGGYTQIGVTSFVSPNGCEGGDPPAFTRVTGYLAWLEEVTGITIEP